MDRLEDLEKKYEEEAKYIPIQEVKDSEGRFKYQIFPKLLRGTMENEEIISEINWPTQSVAVAKPSGLRSLNNPPKPYTHENINSIIWVTCWISTYYYHRENEKRVHLLELITNLPRIKILDKQKALIVSYITEAVGTFGTSTESIFQNLLYLHHHIRDFLSTGSYLKH
jgi:hypothetical protein